MKKLIKNKLLTKGMACDLLVQRGLASTRENATALILSGQVVADDQRVEKAGQLLSHECQLRIKRKDRGNLVSRAGTKLESAVAALNISHIFSDKVILDVGASTGGFTNYALQVGAQHVIALDVGSQQLAWSLRSHSRVSSVENTDIRTFEPNLFPEIDVVLADISFNSLARLAPALRQASPHAKEYLVMVKPQFELEVCEVPRGGVVTDKGLWEKAIENVKHAFSLLGGKNFKVAPAGLKGKKGNQEFFLYFSMEGEVKPSLQDFCR